KPVHFCSPPRLRRSIRHEYTIPHSINQTSLRSFAARAQGPRYVFAINNRGYTCHIQGLNVYRLCSTYVGFFSYFRPSDGPKVLLANLQKIPGVARGGSGVVSESRDNEVVRWPYPAPGDRSSREMRIYVGSASVLESPRSLPH